ncbi:hypothetical protein D9M71_199870 [compost metagenome]
MTTSQAPADLHGWGKIGIEADIEQSGHADEGTGILAFQRPQTKTVLIEMAADAADQCGAFKARQRGGKITHDLRVGAQGDELDEVVILPLAQHQSCAFQLEYGGHRLLLNTSPAVYSVGRRRKAGESADTAGVVEDFFHIRFTCSAQVVTYSAATLVVPAPPGCHSIRFRYGVAACCQPRLRTLPCQRSSDDVFLR